MGAEYMKWTDDLSVNVKELDEQHRKLIDMINILYNSIKEATDRHTMVLLLIGLANYAARHFADEEKYMSLFNYSGQELHKNEHGAFKDKVLEFKDKFESGKASISEEVMVFLQDWLARHITGTDKKDTQVFNANGLS